MQSAQMRGVCKAAVLAALGLAVAGCQASTSVDPSRSFDLQANAAPAGSSFASEVGSLLGQTSPSYVTLTVAEQAKALRRESGALPTAVTSGSGFAAGAPGYVLTAGHVAVKAGYLVTARGADGRLYNGKVIDVRPRNDMALIKLQGYTGTPVIPVGKACLAKGADIFTLGKPHAQGDTVRIGQVESMSFGRAVTYQGFGYPDAMVLKMNTQKGESGGPVFTKNGELAGMVVSTLSDGNGRALNLAHALTASSLADFLCTHVSCTGRWQSLAGQGAACGG